MRVTIPLLATLLSCTSASPVYPLTVVSSRQLESCPVNGNLPPTYLSPTLMVPVSKNLPDVAFGGTQNPLITPNDFCTIFNLVVPPSATGDTCTLEFLFPNNLQTHSPYAYFGGGHFTFTGYAFGSGATEQTTYNNQPPPGPSPPEPPAVLSPGNAYTINVGGCAVEAPNSLEVSGMLCSTDTTFSFYQTQGDELGCPIGFFVGIS
ncbi:Ubiquitin 3 binding protein But2 C-terminal domain containing protein [Hyaloscypha variabilis]